jgi:hypothetical protein
MFLSVLRHLKIQKPTSQQGEKQTIENNKIHADILELCLEIKLLYLQGLTRRLLKYHWLNR